MLGEYSNVDARASRISKGDGVLRPILRRRAVPGLQRRLRAADTVPEAGMIVLRSANQILR